MFLSTTKRIIGVLCIVFGILALFLPVVPGAVLIFIGMELLGLSFLLPHPVRSRWERTKDRAWDWYYRWKGRAKTWWQW